MAYANVAVIIDRGTDTTWHHQAACRDDPSPDWLSDTITDRIAAICASCPIRQDCLDTALREERGAVKSGRGTIRGGLESAERHELARTGHVTPRLFGEDINDVISAAELTLQEAAKIGQTSEKSLRNIAAAPRARLDPRSWAPVMDRIARAIPGADHAPGNTQKGNLNA